VAAAQLDPGAEVLLQLRDLAQAEQLGGELRAGSQAPLEHVEARVLDEGRGAILHLRRR
jgi:hypothetical protein